MRITQREGCYYTNMAKRFAEAGYKIEFKAEDTGSYDVLIDGIKADFKSTKSANHIVDYAKHAIREQGADIVLFEFTDDNPKIHDELFKLRKARIKAMYYFTHSPEKIYKL